MRPRRLNIDCASFVAHFLSSPGTELFFLAPAVIVSRLINALNFKHAFPLLYCFEGT